MAIKTYYGFDYHKKLCGMIGQVVNYRKMAWLIWYESYPLLISSPLKVILERFPNGTVFNQLNFITNDPWVINGYTDLLNKNCTQDSFIQSKWVYVSQSESSANPKTNSRPEFETQFKKAIEGFAQQTQNNTGNAHILLCHLRIGWNPRNYKTFIFKPRLPCFRENHETDN